MFSPGYREFVNKMGPNGQPICLANAALGLCGEVAEAVLELRLGADPISELGDVAFYATALAECVGVSDADISTYKSPYRRQAMSRASYGFGPILEETREQLHHGSGMLAELTKKKLYSSKDIPAAYFAEYLAQVLDAVEVFGALWEHSLEDIQAANVQKLKARWPSGFNV